MILTLALLPLLQPEQYPWYQIGRDRQMTHFVDSLYLRNKDGRRILRHRVDFATAQPNGAITAEYEVAISCEARTIALLEGTAWDYADQIVESHVFPQPTPHSVGQDGVGNILYRFACDGELPIEPSPGEPPGQETSPIS